MKIKHLDQNNGGKHCLQKIICMAFSIAGLSTKTIKHQYVQRDKSVTFHEKHTFSVNLKPTSLKAFLDGAVLQDGHPMQISAKQ